jgi:hypothetical protein
MQSLARLALASTLAGATALVGQTDQGAPGTGAPSKPAPGYVDPAGRFAFDPPAGWRQLTPDEGRTLRGSSASIPNDLLEPQPPHLVTLGDVDQWLRGAFDGKALTVAVVEGEPDLDEAGLAAVRAHFAGLSARGDVRYVVESLTRSAIGKAQAPAIMATLLVTGAGTGASGPHLRLDAYVPTAGKTLSLALTWPHAQRQASEAAWAALCASVQLAGPARGPVRLGSKLLWAALLGVCIGAALHMLRKRSTA